MTRACPIVVFACGERLRGDDGVGPRAVEDLDDTIHRRAAIRTVRTLGPEELVRLDRDAFVVIVDAVVGIPPGTLVRIDLADLGARATNVTPTSTHQLSLPDVIGLAELLGWAPRGVFLGVGAASVAPGEAFSPAVAGALPGLRAAIAHEINSLPL